MNLHFHEILDKNNKIEVTLQELELIILNTLGSQKFKWNDLKDLKRKSTIEDLLRRVRLLLDNSNEVRETIRQLNKEYLRLQLSTKNLEIFTNEIHSKSDEIKDKLEQVNLMMFTTSDESRSEVKTETVSEEIKETTLPQTTHETTSELKALVTDEMTVSELPTKTTTKKDLKTVDFNSLDETVETLHMSPKTEFPSFSYQVVG
ncbi:MAG: hypothetical protein SFU25_00290 [Candidatus Caenarcaniphilales bacterium]|nr:hypothetical protein [Candidatus Caenarcaniphilales bacterium]